MDSLPANPPQPPQPTPLPQLPALVLAHGWGYSRHVFEPLLRALQQHSTQPLPRVLVWDQGYFEANGPQIWDWQPSQHSTSLHTQESCWVPSQSIHNKIPNNQAATYIGIGHSQGLAHILGLTKIDWRGLISLQGFACFVRSTHNPHGVPARVLQHMQAMLRSKPSQVLADFYTRCGDTHTLQHHPERGQSLPPWCIQALHQGLQALEHQDLRAPLAALEAQGVGMGAMLAQNDALLHPEHARQWPAHTPLHPVPGGHTPWLAQPSVVAQALLKVLESLATTGRAA